MTTFSVEHLHFLTNCSTAYYVYRYHARSLKSSVEQLRILRWWPWNSREGTHPHPTAKTPNMGGFDKKNKFL